jgi:hypothetical protein
MEYVVHRIGIFGWRLKFGDLGCVIPSGGGEGFKVDFLPGQIYEDIILPILGISCLS